MKYIKTGLMSTGELALVQAKNEIVVFIERVIKMFAYAKDLYDTKSANKFSKLFSKVKKYEDISDRMEIEIASYLTKISEESVSQEGSEKIASMLSLVSNIESLADAVNIFSNTILRKSDTKSSFTKEMEKNIAKLIEIMDTFFKELQTNLNKKENEPLNFDFKKAEIQLCNLEKTLKQEHFKNLHKGKYKASTGVIYSDIYTDIINIGKHFFNVIELYFSDGKVI